MLYPIIDLITDAYINNGWTGLELTYGKNLLPGFNTSGERSGIRFYSENGSLIVDGTATSLVIIDAGYGTWEWDGITPCFLSGCAPGGSLATYYLRVDGQMGSDYSDGDFGNGTILKNINDNSHIEHNPIKFRFVIRNNATLNNAIINPMLEYGTQVSPYEPYHVPDTDIAHRLKLPISHYFPHPVIDALQRAASSTQTADDTEILRHYLTPLGIGGI